MKYISPSHRVQQQTQSSAASAQSVTVGRTGEIIIKKIIIEKNVNNLGNRWDEMLQNAIRVSKEISIYLFKIDKECENSSN